MQEDQEVPPHTHLHSNTPVAETKGFWKRRTGVDLTEDEAREALQNMEGFVALVSEWSATSDPAPRQNEQSG